MKVFVTGAEGFVGRHLRRHFVRSGDVVLPAESEDGPIVDVMDLAAVRGAIEAAAPDAVVHLAGLSSVAGSYADPSRTFAVNALGTVHLLTAVQERAPRARVLLIGSADMYGAIAEGVRVTEEQPLQPLSPYAAAKVAAEVAGFQFHRSTGLFVVSARSFNHLGAGQRPEFVVPAFAAQIRAMRERRAPPVLKVGNLDAVRDFSHVGDVVEAYRLLLERGEAGEAYNVCSGQGRSIRGLLDRMLELSGVEARIEVDPARLRPIELPYLVGDAGKLRRLGWSPSRALDDALREVLAAAEVPG